jgi:hypothetical protein
MVAATEVGESLGLLLLAVLLIGLAVLPGCVAYLRPSWIRAIVGLGVVLALALLISGGFGDTGDMDRTGSVELGALWGITILGIWVAGARAGLRIRRRRITRNAESSSA